jgi:AcrR family transcriptional regulator
VAIIGRPREFEREAALQKAMMVFWRKGFVATSMNDLCDAMGIRAPSLYAAFGSKEALYLEVVEHYVRTVGPSVWDSLAEGRNAKGSVEGLLLTAVRVLPECGTKPPGCMVTLAAVSEECPGAIPNVLRNVRLDCLQLLRTRLKAGLAAGELPRATDIDRLSRFYLGIYQGIAMQARDGASSEELRGVVDTAMAAWPVLETKKKRRR